MSSNNADILEPTDGYMLAIRNDSYMAGKWSGYGYLAVIQVHDPEKFSGHGHAGTIRNIRDVQSVVWRSPKIYMGGPTEIAWRDDMYEYIDSSPHPFGPLSDY